MRYPDFLQEGGTIGLVAPSCGGAEEKYRVRLEAAIRAFEAKGYRVSCGPNCFLGEGIGKSNTPEKCGAELNDYFSRFAVDVLISCGGGETMCEDLPFVDFDALKKQIPKWYMGYSDNTNLTFLLPTLCDTASVYGQCAGAFGMREWHRSLEDDFRILTGKTDQELAGDAASTICSFTFTNYESFAWKQPEEAEAEGQEPVQQQAEQFNIAAEESAAETETKTSVEAKQEEEQEEDFLAPWELPEPYRMKVFAAGSTEETSGTVRATGRLLGGCLDCLINLCGTRFDRVKEFAEKYREDGTLWFLEACDLSPMAVRRALWQLKEAGWFEGAKGFLIGRPLHFGEEMMGMNMENAVTGILADLNVPVFMDVDLGHIPPAMPMITGAIAEAEAKEGKLTVRQILR